MKWTPETIEKIRKWGEMGYSNKWIAGELGTTLKAVSNAAWRAGVKLPNLHVKQHSRKHTVYQRSVHPDEWKDLPE
jgi:hypothetical protein